MRVLVVDDDAGIRETLGVMLRDEGYEVYEAANGADALQQMWATTEPMVTLLDMWMPQMNGEDTLFAAATHASLWNRLAFIVITANPKRLSEQARTLMESAQIPLLIKPFDIDTVVAAVQEAATGLAGASRRAK